MKRLAVHLALLAVAALLALLVWTRDEPAPEKEAELLPVWGGSAQSLQKLTFEGKNRKFTLDAKQDGAGTYYVGVVQKETPASPANDAHGAASSSPAPLAPPKQETIRFVSVKSGAELAGSLAPLKAVRSVGKVEPARNEEFGLDKPEGTLKVTIDGKEHALSIGATTPGSGERYARYLGTNEVFAIENGILQNVLFAESRLIERDLHGFKPDEVTRVRIARSGKSRELVRAKDKNDAWADPATPTKPDETAGNWMSKVGRLRVSEYVEQPPKPVRPEDQVVALEYFDGTRSLGFLELFKVAGDKGNEFYARSEWGRWYGKVPVTTSEQIENDVASVMK